MTAPRFIAVCALVLIGVTLRAAASGSEGWSATQLGELRGLSLSALEPVPPVKGHRRRVGRVHGQRDRAPRGAGGHVRREVHQPIA